MDQLELKPFIEFNENLTVREHRLSAASGLVKHENQLFIVCDDENALAYIQLDQGLQSNSDRASWTLSNSDICWISLFPENLPEDYDSRKKIKADLEIIIYLNPRPELPWGGLLCLPSGSKQNRSRGALLKFDKDNQAVFLHAIDLSDLYDRLREKNHDLNLEGALLDKEKLFLFHRGNQTSPENRIYEFSASLFLESLMTTYRIDPSSLRADRGLELGHLQQVVLGVTDVCLVENEYYGILSAAEMTTNSYDDGMVVGSVFTICRTDFSVVKQFLFSHPVKAEGVCYDEETKHIYLVADPDNRRKLTTIYQTKILENLE